MKLRYDPYSRTNQYLIDGLLCALSFYLAYLIRFEGEVPGLSAFQFWVLLPMVMVSRLAVNTLFGVYQQMWRYVSITDAIRLAQAYAAFSAVLLALRLGLEARWALFRVPLSIIALEFLFSLYGALGARLLRRILYQWQSHRGLGAHERKRVVLVGAGSAGVMVGKELSLRPDVEVVGFLDDNPKKIGAVIGGCRVLGPTSQLGDVVRTYGVDEVVLCITRAPVETLKRFWRLCESVQVPSLIVPTLDEIFAREVGVSRLRQVKMEELLGRETIALAASLPPVREVFRGKRLLVTGAGGSIGSELVRQLAACEPALLLLVDKDENALFERQQELDARLPRVPFEILLIDVRARVRLEKIFLRHRPEVIFHAAAHKQVPLMELNPAEAVLNNVFGTYDLAELALDAGTERFILISTDKAVKPASVMGASKRLAELVLLARRHRGPTRFISVRFGNVMASRSSVIPLFQKQIAAGGPVTLTHPEMRRFFMTIPEAVQLVVQAGAIGEDGSIYVLDMGDPIRVADLARDLIELAGLRPNQDIRIEIIGLRPGEKLTEELIGDGEALAPTPVQQIFEVVSNGYADWQEFERRLAHLRQAAEQDDEEAAQRLLLGFDIGFQLEAQDLRQGQSREDTQPG